MDYFPPALENLVEQFAKLPGVGRKSAQRLAFYLLGRPDGGLGPGPLAGDELRLRLLPAAVLLVEVQLPAGLQPPLQLLMIQLPGQVAADNAGGMVSAWPFFRAGRHGLALLAEFPPRAELSSG